MGEEEGRDVEEDSSVGFLVLCSRTYRVFLLEEKGEGAKGFFLEGKSSAELETTVPFLYLLF